MRYLVIVMMVPLLLGGCLESIVLNTAYSAGFETSKAVAGVAIGGDNRSHPRLDHDSGSICQALWKTPENPQACSEEWKELSDADFCKHYSPINELVALELKRRKLDCSKLDDSASSK